MTIKQQGGIFGRNPTFNDLTVEGTLTSTGATSYTSLDIDNINIDGNTISSTDTNGNIALDPDGTGLVTAVSDVKLFSQKKVILNRADNATAAEINYQGAAVGLVFNDLNGEGFKFQFGGSDKVVFNYLGNIVVNSGNGIDFSATSGTGTSELFSDYEEGSWTPTDASAAGLTFSAATGTYTKIGDTVTLTMSITYPSNSSSAVIAIGGAPFTAASASGAGGFVTYTNSGVDMQLYYSGSTIRAYINNGASVQNLSVSTDSIQATLIYRAA